MSELHPHAIFVRKTFLPPAEMLAILAALDRLSASWTPSETLKALGRGRTDQVRGGDATAQAALDQIRHLLTPAVLTWAQDCGFPLALAPHLQMFPVRMFGDRRTPAYQEPHFDTLGGPPGGAPRPPVCTNVFYARLKGVVGGGLAVTPKGEPDCTDPLVVDPAVNAIASFSGERVHWVQPLYAGERLSIVVNFY